MHFFFDFFWLLCLSYTPKNTFSPVVSMILKKVYLSPYAIIKCFLHQPWPEKNWMLKPRSFLDIWSNLLAKKESGLGNQYLV